MNRFVVSLGLSLLFSSHAGGADISADSSSFNVSNMAQSFDCELPSGARVAYIPVSNNFMKQYSSENNAAVAWYANLIYRRNALVSWNTPVAYYKQDYADRISEKDVKFIFAHECAHHILKHVDAGLRFFQAGRRMSQKDKDRLEEEADCLAVKHVRTSFNFSKDDIRDYYEAFVYNGDPYWQRRLDIALACYDDAGQGQLASLPR